MQQSMFFQGIGKRKGRHTAIALIGGAAVIFLTLSGQAAEQGASPAPVKQVPLHVPVTSAQGKIMQGILTSARGAAVPKKSALPRPIKELGIEVTALRLTSAGHMLDFRYKVIDPEKAKPVIDKKIKPYLIDQASGARMTVPSPPKIGSLRQTPRASKAGQIYFAIFANPGKFIKAGNKVTVVYGDHKIENLVVE